MYTAEGSHIEMTRGDTAILTVSIDDYTPEDGDTLRFAIKRKYTDSEPIFIKQIDTDSMTFRIEHADTEGLSFGDYVFDVELTRGIDVQTVIPEGTLTLRREVY